MRLSATRSCCPERVPGWPADVPLPVDPQWKKAYAASVRRLVGDGVDKPLAKLFSHVARDVSPTDEGIARARGATEAFLFRRLETLPATAGKFRLNSELPISFDGSGQMEVDLLCADARIAIEIDGSQHFDNEEAYRRDRRKDLLLQEHGFLVLRFLATDVGRFSRFCPRYHFAGIGKSCGSTQLIVLKTLATGVSVRQSGFISLR